LLVKHLDLSGKVDFSPLFPGRVFKTNWILNPVHQGVNLEARWVWELTEEKAVMGRFIL
jgi:hypothetical protein